MVDIAPILKQEEQEHQAEYEVLYSYAYAVKCVANDLMRANQHLTFADLINPAPCIPLLFLCRHTIELAIKTAIKKINGEFKTIEVKVGCGELATILSKEFKLMNGKRTTAEFRNAKFDELPKRNNCFESDFVVYLPEPDLDFPVEYQAYVLDTSDFEWILRSMGMIRYKQTTELKNRGGDYYDRFAIAEFKNSEKRYNGFYQLIEEYGTSFDLWLEENDIE
jgi:hypothetical protein